MNLALILEAVIAALKFPGEVIRLGNFLSKTPQANHDDLLKRMDEEAQKFDKTGRPTWGG